MTSDPFLRVHIQGAGKIGRAFATALRKARWPVRLQSARRGRPRQVDADVVLLTVRDSQLLEEANAWVPIVPSHAVVLHAAGALEPRVLSVLRSRCRGIGQLHPLISVVDTRGGIRFEGAYALIAGNRKACQCATQIARVVGMHPWRNHHLDRATYHAAAGLMAGGTAALFYAATHILVQAGIAPRKAQHMLVPLLRSVADNIEHV
ncbi:MAG TPA: DUF2520 domain-containing protein, partial [Polyangiaceae bacterium]|nr:DUF2520 domain-containing protein [Polyangiaceae bacterium]